MSVRNLKRAEEKRGSIINSAIRTFAKKGFENARISDIAEDAGTAYGLVYHYFKSKDELLNEIIEEKWSIFLKSIREIGKREKGFREKIMRITSLLVDTYKGFPELIKVLVVEYSRSPRLIRAGVNKSFLEVIKVLEDIVKEGKRSGEVRNDVSPLVASLVYIGVIDTLFTLVEINYKGEFVKNLKKRAQAIIDIYLNGLCRK